jgi:hypothetical protein
MFIAISDDTLINADEIQVIKKTKVRKEDVIVVVVNGEKYEVELPFGDFYARLIKAGVSPTEQFFAG